ncbi:MAG: phosphate/phosphite/phosphonate ABC transporter substrate-binding protein [Cyanobacteria bacterium P01_D01_bin.1]
MLGKHFINLTIFGLLLSTVGCSFIRIERLFIPSTAAEGDGVIILTDVDFDPASLMPETQPIAEYLGKNLRKAGISSSEVNIAPDVDTVAEWMNSGEVNLYFDSVYPALTVMKASGAMPILRRWKDGVAQYSTYIVTRKDSGIETLFDLNGKMITLQEPSSSSGFMFPMVYLLEAGLNPQEKSETNQSVLENEIGYVFSGQEEVTAEWILEGRVVAGALDNETLAELSEEDRSQLEIIAETDAFPRHVVLAGPNLEPEQIEVLKGVLVDMDESNQGQKALQAFSETAQFDEFPEGGEAAIARFNAAYQLLQDHLSQ